MIQLESHIHMYFKIRGIILYSAFIDGIVFIILYSVLFREERIYPRKNPTFNIVPTYRWP